MFAILVLCIFLLSILSFYFFDKELCLRVSKPGYSGIHSFSLQWTHLADAKWYFIFTILIVILFGIHFLLRKSYSNSYEKLLPIYRFGTQFFVCLLASGIVVHFFKFLIGRKRPYHTFGTSGLGICETDIFKPFTIEYTFHSFPSGHSQLIFTVVTFLSFYTRSHIIKLVLFVYAFGVALMRVGTRDHFLSDVLMGSFVGFLITYTIMKKLDLKNFDSIRIW